MATVHGCIIPGHQVAVATKCLKAAPNICVPCVRKLLRITFPVSKILRWLLYFGKNLCMSCTVHHKFHIEWPGLNPGIPGERPATNGLRHGADLNKIHRSFFVWPYAVSERSDMEMRSVVQVQLSQPKGDTHIGLFEDIFFGV
jgi:hypothetical protein